MKKLIPLTLILLFGCAAPEVVDSVRLEDEDLTCQELDLEIEETKQLREDAILEKGWTSLNIARFIFRPLIILTYSNVNAAINAADSRLIHLSNIKRDRNCNQKIESPSNDWLIEKEDTVSISNDLPIEEENIIPLLNDPPIEIENTIPVSNGLPIEKGNTIFTSTDPEETRFWKRVIEANNKDMYEFYLFIYPNGAFTGLAQERLRNVRK